MRMLRFYFSLLQEKGVELSQPDIQKEINSANALADQHRQSNIIIKFRNVLLGRNVLLVSNLLLKPSLPRDCYWHLLKEKGLKGA